MTEEFLIQAVLLLAVLVGLDVGLWHLRQRKINLRLPPISLPRLSLSGWRRQPQEKISLSAGDAPQTEDSSSLQNTAVTVIPLSSGRLARVSIQAELPPGSVLHITIRADEEGQVSVWQKSRAAFSWQTLQKPFQALSRVLESFLPRSLQAWLFGLALGVYLLVRLWGLEEYPIYFFADEAVQTVSAAELVQRGWHGPDGEFLPTYFQNGRYFNLGTSVYWQVLPHILFGNSVLVTRGVSVLTSLLAALAVGGILHRFLGARYAWAGILLLSAAPAWFLHSRTAFETVLFVSFYSAFLYFYLAYRNGAPNNLYAAVLWGALAFYAYSPGQLIMAVSGVLFLASDWRYHWSQRGTVWKAAVLLAVAALPYLRFRMGGQYEPADHLRQLGSYWVQPLPLTEKLKSFAGEYLYGLSPFYWFSTPFTRPLYTALLNFFSTPWFDLTQFRWFEAMGGDLSRHQMKDYGHLPLWLLPLLLIGLVIHLKRWKDSSSRVILLAALAAPSGASLAEVGITRALVFVIPASILAGTGLNWLLAHLQSLPTFQNRAKSLAALVFGLLLGINAWMLTDALQNGPLWDTNYGLFGMQYGAKQVYEETVLPILQNEPDAQVMVSASWANGAQYLPRFFLPSPLLERLSLGQIYDIFQKRPPLGDSFYFVVTSVEYEKLIQDPKIANIRIRDQIPAPDGTTAFYLLNMDYGENLQTLLEEEYQLLRTPVQETLPYLGQTVILQHSPLQGSAESLLDGDPHTLAKGKAANPLTLEFFLETPIPLRQVQLKTGSMQSFTVTVRVYPPESETYTETTQTFTDLLPDPVITLPLGNSPLLAGRVFISVKDNTRGDPANVHIWEVLLQ